MAISANGMIAKADHDTPWSDDEFESYKNKVIEIGNLVIGKTTYDLTIEDNGFDNLRNPFIVVLTTSGDKPRNKNTIFVKSFNEAIKVSQEKKFENMLIAGGGKMNKVALESGKIDEIFLDVEPFIFGKGINLFAESDMNLNLKLIGTKKVGKNGIQLHYEVTK